jgi:hypothetical protein
MRKRKATTWRYRSARCWKQPDQFKAFVTRLVEGPKKEQALMNVAWH